MKKLQKIIILAVVSFICLLGIGYSHDELVVQSSKTASTNKPKYGFKYQNECIRGVVYYEYMSRLAPAFKPDGTLYTCGDTSIK
jgi:hypothetical protein